MWAWQFSYGEGQRPMEARHRAASSAAGPGPEVTWDQPLLERLAAQGYRSPPADDERYRSDERYLEPHPGHPLGPGMPSGRPLGEGGSHRERWMAILRRDPCAYCSPETREPAGTVDHLTPLSARQPNANAWTNLAGACSRCNSRKGAKSMLMFLLGRARQREQDRERSLLYLGEHGQRPRKEVMANPEGRPDFEERPRGALPASPGPDSPGRDSPSVARPCRARNDRLSRRSGGVPDTPPAGIRS